MEKYDILGIYDSLKLGNIKYLLNIYEVLHIIILLINISGKDGDARANSEDEDGLKTKLLG